MPTQKTSFVYRSAIWWPLAAGILAAALTVGVGTVATISENPVMGALQKFLVAAIMPGFIGSMAVGGNVHAFSILIAAAINGLLYNGLFSFLRFASTLLRK